MNSDRTSNAEKLESDIVILGGGGAGFAAAVAAAELGASVVVLEKRHAPGGNTSMAEGLFAAESPAQKRMGIDAPRDKLFKIAMDYSHWEINPRIVRAFVDKSGDTIQWLEDKGLVFDWIPSYFPGQVLRTWHCPKKGGAAVVELLAKNFERLGVQLYCRTQAKKIFTTEKGRVTGVLAAMKGKELRIAAKSVIISTGGYAGNKKLLRKYYSSYNENIYCRGLPHMGDGLRMATELGAATEGLGILHLNGPMFVGSLDLWAVVQEPNTIWVNRRGERFIDEAVAFNHFESVNGIIRQLDKISYTLFDDKIRQNIIKEGVIKGRGIRVPQYTKLSNLDNNLQLQVEKGMAKISHSWVDIARWIGADPEVLAATISEYNAFCDQGHDAIFAKDQGYLVPLRTPPYYAIKCYPSFMGTIGGIKINERMEVLDYEDNPIPGLYAAGSDTGGWESGTYCVALSGTTFGFALNSGRIAGENAARYVFV